MKKLLLLAAVLCMGALQANRHENNGSCNTCHTGCAVKKACNDCQITTTKEVRKVMLPCDKWVKVTEMKPAEEYRYVTKCLPKTEISEWVRPSCPSGTCNKCLKCKERAHGHARSVAVDEVKEVNEAPEAKQTRKEVTAKQTRSEKKGFFSRNNKKSASEVAADAAESN